MIASNRPAYHLHHCNNVHAHQTSVFPGKPSHPRALHLITKPVTHASMGSSSTLLQPGQELDDAFTGLADANGLMSVAGFGSLLSETSARTTFPELINFRMGKLRGYRRVFAHCADIFYQRGIARPETGEVSSLSCEPCDDQEIVVAVFEVAAGQGFVEAFIQREHEFRFLAVAPDNLDGSSMGRLAVLCARNTDEEYKARRCPPEEWQRRWAKHGVDRIWRDDILPCRVYLRHCVLAAKSFGPEAYDSFMDNTFLADRTTTIRQYLEQHPDIMLEQPPPELVGRYSG